MLRNYLSSNLKMFINLRTIGKGRSGLSLFLGPVRNYRLTVQKIEQDRIETEKLVMPATLFIIARM